ncbi:MAG: fluoride efflux transporter CrcB [Streptosporangiales bacterium]|nr:fluoride efflux transporter CrcB [Streptosporangiales bacterium]
MTAVLLVVVGGAIGAPLRYVTDRLVQQRHDQLFPWGTLTVNAVGSLILGVVAGLSSAGVVPAWVAVLVGTGFCGALTTFSTFSYETLRLLEEGAPLEAALNVAASLVIGLGAATAGYAAVGYLV